MGQKPQKKAKDIERREIRTCPKSEGGRHVFTHYYDSLEGENYSCQFCFLIIVLKWSINRLDNLKEYV